MGWHYTCPLRGSARAVPYEIGGTRDTTVRERCIQHGGCGWRTYRKTERCARWLWLVVRLDGLVVHGDISSDDSQTVHKDLTKTSVDAPNHRRGSAVPGCRLPARRFRGFHRPLTAAGLVAPLLFPEGSAT